MSAGIVAVDELTRAYRAALEGEFRTGARHAGRVSGSVSVWSPAEAERVFPVVGCLGGAGASTVALGLATAAGDARVVECCTVGASGLAAASSVELGTTADGWVQGARDTVLIERRGDRVPSIAACPAPSAGTKPLSILDCSWDVDLLVADNGWLGATIRAASVVVVVTRPTVPGLRCLEAALGLLGAERVHAVLVGVERRWPRQVEQGLGQSSREVRAAGRLIGLPSDSGVAVNGLTPEPLPVPIVQGCSALLTSLKGSLR
jgi:hypothetical protein